MLLQHWKQFLNEVSQELLQLEKEEAELQLSTAAAARAALPVPAASSQKTGTAAARAATAAAQDPATSDALAAVAAALKVCKWCGGSGKGNSSLFGDIGSCAAAFAAAAPSITTAAAAAAAVPAAAAAAVPAAAATADDAVVDGCTPSGRRIIALVERYSYMTKYVAMLNPGEFLRLCSRVCSFTRYDMHCTPAPCSVSNARAFAAACS